MPLIVFAFVVRLGLLSFLYIIKLVFRRFSSFYSVVHKITFSSVVPSNHSRIPLFVLMHLVQLVMVRLWTTNGSMTSGFHTKFLSQLPTRNLFLLFWLPMSGVLVGLAGVPCFTLITKRWVTFSIHGLLQA